MNTRFALVGALLLSACTSTDYTLRSEPIGRQVSVATAGLVSVQSSWAGSTVTVSPEDSVLEGPLRLRIMVENTSAQPADFGPENVFVSYGGQTWVPAKSFLHLKANLDSDAQVAKIGVAVLGAVTAGLIASQHHVSADQKQDELNNTAQDMEAADADIDAGHSAQLAQLESRTLQTTTVAPGQTLDGSILADAPPLDPHDPAQIFVKINFGQDTHVLRFSAVGPWEPAPVPVAQSELSALIAQEAQNGISPRVQTADAPQLQAALCTKDSEAVARAAQSNGFQYHSPCI